MQKKFLIIIAIVISLIIIGVTVFILNQDNSEIVPENEIENVLKIL